MPEDWHSRKAERERNELAEKLERERTFRGWLMAFALLGWSIVIALGVSNCVSGTV